MHNAVLVDLDDVHAQWETMGGKSDKCETCSLLRAHSRVIFPGFAREPPRVRVQSASGVLQAFCR